MSAALANGIASVLNVILNFLQIVIIISVILSWVNADPYNPIVQIINRIVEPLYKPFRGLARKIPGPLDFTPFIVLLIIIFIKNSVVYYLMNYAATARF